MGKRPFALCCMVIITIQIFRGILGGELNPPVIPFQSNENISIIGTVYQMETRPNYQLLYVKQILTTKKSFSKEIRMLVYDSKFQPLAIGNVIEVEGTCQLFETPRNPGNFDQALYYATKEIVCGVQAKSISVRDDSVWIIPDMLATIRMRWNEMIIDVLGEKDGGILSAMMLGEKSALAPEQKELYQRNGIGHLLAISGLHVSFLGMFLYNCLRKIRCPRGVAGTVSIVFLCLYAQLTGFGVSTQRALLMFVIRMGADLFGRVYDMETSLWVTACCMIVNRPIYLRDPGFLLSFGAIAALIYIYPLWNDLCPSHSKWLDSIFASSSIQLFLFPVTLFYFFEIPTYSTLLNLVVIPFMSVILLLGMGGSICYWIIPGIGKSLLCLTRIIFRIYDLLCKTAIKLPCARIVFGKPHWMLVLGSYLIFVLFWMLVFRKHEDGIRKRWIVVCFCGMVLVSVPWQYFSYDRLRITVVDVGQGDGIYIKGPHGGHYFVDGGSSDVKKVGSRRMEPFLKSQGVGSLDYVFISHGDGDHLSGVEELLERQETGIRIQNLVLTAKSLWDERLRTLAKLARENGTKVLLMESGECLTEGELQWSCLQPSHSYKGEIGNASSMVLHLSFRQFDMLFTGDVEKEGEEVLCEQVWLPEVEVLKVSHHGSKHSTKEELLDRLQPKIGLISAGRKNSYGHPHEATLKRLGKYGVTCYSTQQYGAITLETDGRDKLMLYSEIADLLY